MKEKNNSYSDILNQAITAHTNGNMHEAEKLYLECISLNNKDPIVLNNLACISYVQQNFEKSEHLFLDAISADPNYAEAYNNRGNIYKKIGDLIKANEYYQKAIAINPKYADAYSNLGILFQKEGDIQNAKKYFQKALSINPGHRNFQNNLATVLISTGRHEEACSILEKIILEHADFIQAYMNLGQLLLEQKKYRKCFEVLEQAQSIQSIDPISYIQILILQIYAGYNICYWEKISEKKDKLSSMLEENNNIHDEFQTSPFYAQAIGLSSKHQNTLTKAFCHNIPGHSKYNASSTSQSSIIKIAYISPDFNQHPIALLLGTAFKFHNRNEFEIHAFSYDMYQSACWKMY